MAKASLTTPSPPAGTGPMSRKESRLAFSLLTPTFAIVLAIVLIPLLANFWISVKPVELADLRPPTPIANERLRGTPNQVGDEVTIEYRLRNSSQKKSITNINFTDQIPDGLKLLEVDSRCELIDRNLSCSFAEWSAGFSERLRFTGIVEQAYLNDPINPKDSKPLISGESENVLTNLEFTLENFLKVFSGSEFLTVLWVTFAYTIFGTLGAIVLGLFAALLLNTKFRGQGMLRGLFLFPYVAPVIAVAFTWVILLDPLSGTLNSLLVRMNVLEAPINFFGVRAIPINIFGLTLEFPLALTTVIAFEAWRYFPLSFLFILARMQSISTDMYEAAEVDGATPLQQFWYISLPQLVGILSILFLLRFIWTFNKFDDIFLLTGGGAGTRTLTVDVYEQGFALSNLGAGAAVAVVIFFLLVGFALIYFRSIPKEEGL